MLFAFQSVAVWSISEGALTSLIGDLSNENISVSSIVTWSFQRVASASIIGTTGNYASVPLNETVQQIIISSLTNSTSNTANFTNLYPTFQHLTVNAFPNNDMPFEYTVAAANATLQYHKGSGGQGNWWTLNQTTPHILTSTDTPATQQMLEMIIFNDRVVSDSFQLLANYGIIGLYVSFVFVVGRFIRLATQKMANTIMFDNLPQCDTLMRLCDTIYLCREMGHFDLEESLFNELIMVYRSSEGLIAWTDPQLVE